MKKKLLIGLCSVIVAGAAGAALADLNYTQGAGTIIFDFICFTTKHCSAHVNIDSTGTEKFTTGNPGNTAEADGANVTLGAKADVAWTTGSGSGIALLKATATGILNPIPAQSNQTTNIGSVNGVVNVSPVDCSGTIAATSTTQNLFSASAVIHGFTVANIDSTAGSGEPVWISLTGTATANTAGSYPLAAPATGTFAGLSSYSTPLGLGINTTPTIVAVTIGHKYSCTRW